MVTQLLVSAVMMITPFQPIPGIPVIPKQYAVLISDEENRKPSSRKERRANMRRKKR